MTEWYNKDLIITGHKKGIVKLWFKILERDPSTGEVRWNLVLAHQLRLRNSIDGTLDHSDIISLFISNTRKTLFTGSKEGRVYSFVMPDTPDTFHLQREDKCKECMSCGKVFSVLERKIHCRTCGGKTYAIKSYAFALSCIFRYLLLWVHFQSPLNNSR